VNFHVCLRRPALNTRPRKESDTYMESSGNVVRLADHPRRRKASQRALAAPDPGSQYFCLRCETDQFRLYASGVIHCARCGALMRNINVSGREPPVS
jgi:hypothetical protein